LFCRQRAAAVCATAVAEHAPNLFLTNLAMVLCVAAVTTVVFQRLRQPVVLGYLLAGLIVGPYLPVPLVADRAMFVGARASRLNVPLLRLGPRSLGQRDPEMAARGFARLHSNGAFLRLDSAPGDRQTETRSRLAAGPALEGFEDGRQLFRREPLA